MTLNSIKYTQNNSPEDQYENIYIALNSPFLKTLPYIVNDIELIIDYMYIETYFMVIR